MADQSRVWARVPSYRSLARPGWGLASAILVATLTACGNDGSREPFVAQAAAGGGAGTAAPESAPEAQASQAGLEPVETFKQKSKRLAMLGLDYSTGKLVVVPEEARQAMAMLAVDPKGREREVAQELMAHGFERQEAGASIDAVADFTRALLLAPDWTDTYVALAQALTLSKMTDKALVVFASAVEVDPSSAELWYHLGDYQWRAGLQEEARASLAECLARDLEHAGAHKKLASIHFLTHEDAEAWSEIFAAEAAGESVPPQLRAQLAQRSPEPARTHDGGKR